MTATCQAPLAAFWEGRAYLVSWIHPKQDSGSQAGKPVSSPEETHCPTEPFWRGGSEQLPLGLDVSAPRAPASTSMQWGQVTEVPGTYVSARGCSGHSRTLSPRSCCLKSRWLE